MTKSELIARLAARHPQLLAKDLEFAVNMILDTMSSSLSEGRRIEILLPMRMSPADARRQLARKKRLSGSEGRRRSGP